MSWLSTMRRKAGGADARRSVVSGLVSAVFLMACAGLQAQAPTVTGFVGSSNVPQTNSVTGLQAPPSSIVVQGTGFTSGVTTAVFGTFPASAPQVTSPGTMVVAVPPAFVSSAVGTTTTLAVCNGSSCATGGPAITLTVTPPVPSAGTLTATPTPVTTVGTTVVTAQFARSTASGTTLPEPGAPSGTVAFSAAGAGVGSAPLVLDSTATFAATTTAVSFPVTATPAILPVGGTYAGAQSVTITDATAGAAIYYTLDGTPPSAASTLYRGAFPVSTSTTVTAIAIASGYLNSATATAAYNIFIPIPTSVAFVQQPTTSVVNVPFSPTVTAAILDQNGNVIASETDPVSIQIASNPGDTGLTGTTSVNAVNGVATFTGISIPRTGNGYTLRVYDNSQQLQSLPSSAFNINPPPITVTPFAPLVGVTTTLPGSFTLGSPAGGNGATVSLTSSVPANVTISPATVFVAPGQTTGNFTYTGVAPGASNLTASASNYSNGVAAVTATYSLVSLGTIPPVAPGQSVSLALSIATPAPAGGLTVNFTSSNPSVATVTSSVFIPAGQRTAATNPQIVGIIIGTTTITATAQGYAPDTRAVNVTVVATFSPTSITIAHQTYNTTTLNISAPAQTGGLTFTLSSDKPATATVVSSVTVPAGQTSVIVPITGVADGSTTLRADSPGVTEATLPVTVSSQLGLYYGAPVTGVNMLVGNYISLPSAPGTPTTVTVTSNNPALVTVSNSITAVGTASITYPGVTTANTLSLYFQGQNAGTASVTISAPGYTSFTTSVNVYPSGFVFNQSITTTTFSPASTVTLYPAILNPASLTEYTTAQLSPGVGPINVPVTSSNPSVGTITTSPVVVNAGVSYASTTFLPTGTAGTSTIAIGTPSPSTGFSTPSNNVSFTATVSAPQLSFYYGSQTTGVNLLITNLGYIPVAPNMATTFTVTSSNPSVATLSTSQTVVGTASVSFPGVTTANGLPFYIQGQSVGTSTLTFSANGYTSGTTTITVYPSGFTFYSSSSFSTTTFSPATQVNVFATILNPQTLTANSYGQLNPGVGTITVPVSSSNPSVGTVTNSPLTFTSGDQYHSVNFQPSNAGTSNLTIGVQTGGSGFSTPASSATTDVATVTAPQLSYYYGNQITGVNMLAQNVGSIPVTPPSATTFTVTSSNPAVATVSTATTTVGTASVTFPGVTSSSGLQFYIQGQTTGTSTITFSGQGYTSATTTITVYPSGFAFSNGSGFSTTTFSTPTTLYVYPSILNPQSLTVYTTGQLNPGIASASVSVTSANTSVGTISTSPLVFAAGSSYLPTTFQPTSAGTSTISLSTPPGFSTPANNASAVATVTAPQLSFANDLTTGARMMSTDSVYLPVAPPNAVTVTVVSNGPAISTISTSPTVVGTNTLTFTNVTTAGYLPTIYVQGQSVGSTTLTVSAPGYTNGTAAITIYPSGFTFGGQYNGGLTTNSTSPPSALAVYPSVLNPGTLTYYTTALLNPGLGGTSVGVTSSNTAVGTISTSPLIFNGGEYDLTTNFRPVSAGTSNINIIQPAGFSTPSQYTGFIFTVQP